MSPRCGTSLGVHVVGLGSAPVWEHRCASTAPASGLRRDRPWLSDGQSCLVGSSISTEGEQQMSRKVSAAAPGNRWCVAAVTTGQASRFFFPSRLVCPPLLRPPLPPPLSTHPPTPYSTCTLGTVRRGRPTGTRGWWDGAASRCLPRSRFGVWDAERCCK